MEFGNITTVYALLMGVAYTCIGFLVLEVYRRRKRDKEIMELIFHKIKNKEENKWTQKQ